MNKIELIDRAALLERLEKYRDMPLDNHTFRGAKIPPMLLEMRQVVFCDVEQLLRAAPTIDSAPVRRGEWVFNFETSAGVVDEKCSVCRSWYERPSLRSPYNFCPNCGAQMSRPGNGEIAGGDER